jgi:hypothetical protein
MVRNDLLPSLTVAAQLKQERDALARDAARFDWYFGRTDKIDFMQTYLTGMKDGWTPDQWRAAIDAAMKETFCENPPPEIVSRIDGDTLVRRVEDAIADSSREDRTVTLDDEPGLRDELLVASDDNAEVDGVVQYWGTDDEGRPWRVHVALALDA